MGEGALDVGGRGERAGLRSARDLGATELKEVERGSLAWREGRVFSPEQPLWAAADRGPLYGDGLFETLRVVEGRPVWLARHLSRFRRSAAAFGFPGPERLAARARRATLELLRSDQARALLRRHRGHGVLRLTWSRGPSERGFAPPARSHPSVVAHLSPPPEARGAARVIVAHGLVAGSLAGHKTCSAIVYVEAARRARAAGVEEALLEDGAGGLAEASAANLFVVAGAALLTPPTSLPLLPGITRAWALARARRHRSLRLEVAERAVSRAQLLAADEAFLTSSVRGIVPLVAVEGEPIGAGRPGRVSRALAREWGEATGAPPLRSRS